MWARYDCHMIGQDRMEYARASNALVKGGRGEGKNVGREGRKEGGYIGLLFMCVRVCV